MIKLERRFIDNFKSWNVICYKTSISFRHYHCLQWETSLAAAHAYYSGNDYKDEKIEIFRIPTPCLICLLGAYFNHASDSSHIFGLLTQHFLSFIILNFSKIYYFL